MRDVPDNRYLHLATFRPRDTVTPWNYTFDLALLKALRLIWAKWYRGSELRVPNNCWDCAPMTASTTLETLVFNIFQAYDNASCESPWQLTPTTIHPDHSYQWFLPCCGKRNRPKKSNSFCSVLAVHFPLLPGSARIIDPSAVPT